ncbi:MAG: efflux RND transporter permease subunit [Acidobacteria bacterium]|nr:efflux RND transporter permease subunit [Acidobacteriota bacterium]MBU4405074.1 efflux RND transporter permease subunit [Acidobacteriota bacterium]MCG2811676.1 efflux RND transporter permease subunit [Candidatus Aminicenantes bacterium]
MNISDFSIRRPVFTVMLTLAIVAVGMVAVSRLPIDLMPDITFPTLSISTSYENTGPEEIEQIITRPIEEAMSAVPGVEEVFSVSSEGNSNVRVMFSWGTDLSAAADDMRERLDRVIPRLPDDVDRPMLRKFDPAMMPILIVGALSKLDPIQTRRIIDEQIAYRLERVPGVASVTIWGGHEREIQVNLHADKIKALGLPLDRIITGIREGNVDLPAGVIERGNYEILIRIPGVFSGLKEIRDTVVAVRDGVPIRLGEIADIEDTFRKITRIVRVNGVPGTRLAIYKQSGTNTVNVADGVLKEIARIQEDRPQVQLIPVRDSSEYIKNAMTNVSSTAVYGGLLAIFVLLFFLGSVRSTLVIATAIPISIVATFALIYFGGFTLNIMTLGGLALGIGMLVDNSIVVLENIVRLKEKGVPPMQAARDGTREVAGAVVASTLTTLAVFLPMVFVRGIAGIMFKQLAYVVSFSLICSLFVALTLVPMLSSRFLQVSAAPQSRLEKWKIRAVDAIQRFLASLESWYRKVLHAALDHRAMVLIAVAILLAGSIALVRLVGSEFMPSTDEGEVRLTIEMEVGTRLAVIDERFKAISSIVRREVPEMASIEESIGGGGWRRGSHSGNITIKLKPKARRSRSSEEIALALRRSLQDIPGAIIRARAGGGQFFMRGGGDEERVQVEIRGFNLETSAALAQQVKKIVEGVRGVSDVRLSRDMGKPEELLVIDRQAAADMKLPVSQIGSTLETVLSGTQASTFREGGDEFRILVKVKDAESMTMDDILNLTLTNSAGQPVSLRNVVDVSPRSGPQRIERRDRERVLTISAEIEDRDLSSILADIRAGIRNIPIPRDFEITFTGDFEEQQKAFRELLVSIILALMLVYMIMAMLYESVRDPFIVMFSVPLAAIGVIWMLLLTGTTFNMQSYIGCIMLGGIVVNNAILLVDHTNLLRRRDKMGVREAIEEAGRRRLRPILMTAMTTILAMMPLALGLREGSEAQAPMARAVVGGLLSSTLITLIVVPIVYSLFEGKKERK